MEFFFALLAFCVGISPVTDEFPSQRPVTRSFDGFFDLRLNERLSNNREAGDMRRHRTQYYVIIIFGVYQVQFNVVQSSTGKFV